MSNDIIDLVDSDDDSDDDSDSADSDIVCLGVIKPARSTANDENDDDDVEVVVAAASSSGNNNRRQQQQQQRQPAPPAPEPEQCSSSAQQQRQQQAPPPPPPIPPKQEQQQQQSAPQQPQPAAGQKNRRNRRPAAKNGGSEPAPLSAAAAAAVAAAAASETAAAAAPPPAGDDADADPAAAAAAGEERREEDSKKKSALLMPPPASSSTAVAAASGGGGGGAGGQASGGSHRGPASGAAAGAAAAAAASGSGRFSVGSAPPPYPNRPPAPTAAAHHQQPRRASIGAGSGGSTGNGRPGVLGVAAAAAARDGVRGNNPNNSNSNNHRTQQAQAQKRPPGEARGPPGYDDQRHRRGREHNLPSSSNNYQQPQQWQQRLKQQSMDHYSPQQDRHHHHYGNQPRDSNNDRSGGGYQWHQSSRSAPPPRPGPGPFRPSSAAGQHQRSSGGGGFSNNWGALPAPLGVPHRSVSAPRARAIGSSPRKPAPSGAAEVVDLYSNSDSSPEDDNRARISKRKAAAGLLEPISLLDDDSSDDDSETDWNGGSPPKNDRKPAAKPSPPQQHNSRSARLPPAGRMGVTNNSSSNNHPQLTAAADRQKQPGGSSQLRTVPRGGRSARALTEQSGESDKPGTPSPPASAKKNGKQRSPEAEEVRKALASTLKINRNASAATTTSSTTTNRSQNQIKPTHLSPNRLATTTTDVAKPGQSCALQPEPVQTSCSSLQEDEHKEAAAAAAAAATKEAKEKSAAAAASAAADEDQLVQAPGEKSAESRPSAAQRLLDNTSWEAEEADEEQEEQSSDEDEDALFESLSSSSSEDDELDAEDTVCAQTFDRGTLLQEGDEDVKPAVADSVPPRTVAAAAAAPKEQGEDNASSGSNGNNTASTPGLDHDSDDEGRMVAAAVAATAAEPEVETTAFVFEDDAISPGGPRLRRRGAARVPASVSPSSSSLLENLVYSSYEAPECNEYEFDTDDDGEIPAIVDDVDIPFSMMFVDHLCTLSIDTNGLPIWRFSVLNGKQDILYDFEVTIRPSEVCDGLGSFLTFLGGRKLNPRLAEKTRQILAAKADDEKPETDLDRELQAQLPTGYGVTVRVEGEFRDSKINIHSAPGPPVDVFSVASPVEPVNRAENGGFQCRNTKTFKVGNSAVGIGEGQLQKEVNFLPDINITFSTEENSVAMGRYGPFLKSDRKTDELYHIKSFLYSGGPAEYAFTVEEPLFFREHTIDITDEATGTPHQLARENVFMYVNEVSRGNARAQNVYIRAVDDRVVFYYLYLPDPLDKMESVELLTNYGANYEDVRERHGYGFKILRGTMKSDLDRASRFQRNYVELQTMEEIILSNDRLGPSELVEMCEYLSAKIWLPLLGEARRWATEITHSDTPLTAHEWTSPLIWRQWVAIRKMHWLRDVILKRIEQGLREAPFPPYQGCFTQCKGILKDIRRELIRPVLLVAENEKAVDITGTLIRPKLLEDAIEEICYSVRDKLPSAFDGSLWCPTSQRLIERLCQSVSLVLYAEPAELPKVKKGALNEFLVAALEARDEILGAPATSTACLAFESGLHPIAGNSDRLFLTGSLQETLKATKSSSSFFLDNSTLPKALKAAAVEKLTYMDALVVAGIEPQVDRFEPPLEVNGEFFMVECAGFGDNEDLQALGSVPRTAASAERTSSKANKTWYVIWQVAYAVHVLASEYLADTDYSLEMLCAKLGIDQKLVEYAVSRGIRQDIPDTSHLKELMGTKNPGRKRRKKRSKTKKRKHSSGSESRPKKKTGAPGAPRAARVPPKLIFEGEPDVVVPANKWWPEGWMMRTYQRMNGATKGSTDRYWYTPQKRWKLRSGVEIRRFCECLDLRDGNEEEAWATYKGNV